MPKAVIFDVDGTLIDTNELHARSWAETFRHFGHPVPVDEIRPQIGKGGDQLMPVFLERSAVEEKGEAMERFRAELVKRALPQTRTFPFVRELFERIRAAGMRIALATSAKAEELEHYLEIAGIPDLVDARTSSDDAERSKPEPDIFRAALERLDLPPAEAVVVGDAPYDAKAAGKAGMRAVGLLSGGFPEAELRQAGCVAIYRDAEDLLRNFETSPLAPR
ncbi:MAG TPA: HAD family hydrolase [Mesorhizobium sp.]|jgi:HAD superfamily hydrolase (TIGR01509 family)|nr:HAD family hydrolase [Mesorhizobium sp.]